MARPGQNTLQLSVLDQAPVAEGSNAGEALHCSVELARHVERLGYQRFWMSEHHAMAMLACASPEVVLARVGAATERIRIGSGGIMLPHYSPMKVAENFLTLHAMYPGRIDLGVGRAAGGGALEAAALRRDRQGGALHGPADNFPEQVAELLAWLGQAEGFPPGHPFSRIELSPASPGTGPGSGPRSGPEVWLLGSSMWGAAAAAEWGLPYAFAHFFSPVATRAALESYRRTFRPSPMLAAPKAVAAIGVIVADSDEEARHLHASVRLLQQRIRHGDRRPVAAPEAAEAMLRQEFGMFGQTPDVEEGEYPRYLTGSPATVYRELSAMASSLGLAEVVVNTITHSQAARLRSYTLLAEAFELPGEGKTDHEPAQAQVAAYAS